MLVLIISAVVLINITPVQNYLVKKVAGILSAKLKTKVEVAHVRLDFLNHFLIQGVYIEDQHKDTLLYAGELQVRVSDWFIFRDKPIIHYLGVKNTYVHMYRKANSGAWNSDFVADVFSGGAKNDTTASKPFELGLEKIELDQVRFHMDDAWGGEDMDYDIGSALINSRTLDFKKEFIDVKSIDFGKVAVFVREFRGGKPRKPKLAVDSTSDFDPTPFNPDHWKVKVGKVNLKDCSFALENGTSALVPGIFNEEHIDIKDIQIKVEQVDIVGDTIHGKVNLLKARERCGIVVNAMTSDVTVSPVHSICSNLYLETGFSKMKNYYAMNYRHFPDFLSYIDSVEMVGHLDESIIDERDIAYFAPQLKDFPHIQFTVSGNGRGTVANVSADHIRISDGISVMSGNGSMKGLPDIMKTYITFTDGEISTTSKGILKYVPTLRDSSDIAIDSVSYLRFKGNYGGFLEDFALNGIFYSNLGIVGANVKLKIPGFASKTAEYSGLVTSDKFRIGTLLKQPLFGGISMNENISGSSFDPEYAQMKLVGAISEFTIKDYTYHNIVTNGLLAKKQFAGNVVISDSNLSMVFDGGINYSNKNVEVDAKATLKHSNFKALNLTNDTITASGQFDLKCTGSDIDNFSGYAKVIDIDMKRNSHKLAIDSVQVTSSWDGGSKKLTLQSTNIIASISGNYQLIKLPASIQYYLSRYLPDYIKTPDKYPPDQNFEFAVETYFVDSIFAVTYPLIRGFDSSTFKGSLNTASTKLTLSANVPYGSIGKFHMSNIAVEGLGNLQRISLSSNIDNVAIGDSFINGSLSLTTTVGNDSVAFTVATTTPDTSTSITLNGKILAHSDSLFLTILPSQFFLSQAKWDIAGGSKVVYSDKYLMVQGFEITSGLQRISAGTEMSNNDKSLLINMENLDLGQLGIWAGLSAYQPDGRLNGTVTVQKIFQDLYVQANINASRVKLGADTIGTINVIGFYDGARQLISIDPQTGIYRDNASIIAACDISLDSASNQKLQGNIKFVNTPASWASPFVAGIMSKLAGVVNGNIELTGSSYKPILAGNLNLRNGSLHFDYLGTSYVIPSANIHVDNTRISLGKIPVFDAYLNTAILSGHFSHNLFKDMRMHLKVESKKFEVMNLTSNDNNIFYGNLIAGMDSFTVRGHFNDIYLHAFNAYPVNAYPAPKSKLYIPVTSGGDGGTYNYVSFKTYGKNQEKVVKKDKFKMDIKINANMNENAEMHIVLDPSSGDEIMSVGTGTVDFEMPPNNDISLRGRYTINDGYYRFTFKQLHFGRQFKLKEGSAISFEGPFASTKLSVDAMYSTRAKLIDLLSETEKSSITYTDLYDAKAAQLVNVTLHMNGYLSNPMLTFDLGLEDKHSESSLAYRKLSLINDNDRQKFDQVASLLLINSFLPPEGIGGSTVTTGAINNVSQIISSSASSGLTTLVNKITGDKQLNIDVKYTNYNYSDQSIGALNRTQVKLGVSKNYFNNRLTVELGSTSDWGKSSANTGSSSFNITGDFRLQYVIKEGSGLRLNSFSTSDYDVLRDKDIQRFGVGISWKKSFDNLNELIHGNKYAIRERAKMEAKLNEENDSTNVKPGGGN